MSVLSVKFCSYLSPTELTGMETKPTQRVLRSTVCFQSQAKLLTAAVTNIAVR